VLAPWTKKKLKLAEVNPFGRESSKPGKASDDVLIVSPQVFKKFFQK
jgi:hypothetical protein